MLMLDALPKTSDRRRNFWHAIVRAAVVLVAYTVGMVLLTLVAPALNQPVSEVSTFVYAGLLAYVGLALYRFIQPSNKAMAAVSAANGWAYSSDQPFHDPLMLPSAVDRSLYSLFVPYKIEGQARRTGVCTL